MNARHPLATTVSINNVIYVDFGGRRVAETPASESSPSPSPLPSPATRGEERRRLGAVRRRLAREGAVSDDTLAERMAIGDGVSLDALEERYHARMFGAARVILEDYEEAERIVALGFEEASEGWPPERGHVERWLLRLTRRAARARRRALEGAGYDDD